MKWFFLIGLFTATCSCTGDDFTSFNEIDRLRVLAIGSNKPWLRPTETASISALVVKARDDNAPVSHRWSWCPLTQGSDQGFECAITHQELQGPLDEEFGAGVVRVPPFELGTTSSITFPYDLPPAFYEAACEVIASQDVPDFVPLPECDGTFPITIRLVASDSDEETVAIRELEMVYDDSVPDVNTNPVLNGVFASVTGGSEFELLTATSTTFLRDLEYDLRASAEPPETYGPMSTPEELILTWFVDKDSGDLDRTRTSKTPATDTLAENKWVTSKAVDYPPSTARFFLVLRDNRRGITWMTREVGFRGAQQ